MHLISWIRPRGSETLMYHIQELNCLKNHYFLLPSEWDTLEEIKFQHKKTRSKSALKNIFYQLLLIYNRPR
jgi:hypothetical protein